MNNTDNLKPAQTVMLACVIREDTHEAAVKELQRLLGIISADAEKSGDRDIVSLVDECWMPNDCPNSEWPVVWAHEVTAPDLIRAEMFRQDDKKSPMPEQKRKYDICHTWDPGLSLFRGTITEASEMAAEGILSSSYHVETAHLWR